MLTTFVLLQYVYQAIFFTFAFCLHLSLFWRIVSPSMRHQLLSNFIFYLFCWILTSFTGIVQAFYMAIDGYFAGKFLVMLNKSVCLDEFYGPFVFWFGLCFRASSTVTSFAVAFLLLDRIAILTWPISFARKQLYFVTLSVFVSVTSSLILIIAIPLVELPIQQTTNCSVFVCMIKVFPPPVLPAMKSWPGLFTVIFVFVFAFKLIKHQREHFGTQRSLRQANIITGIACCTELFLNLLPFFAGTITVSISGNKSIVTGPYPSVFLATDSLVSAICYNIMLRKNASSQTSRVGTQTQQAGRRIRT
ncbi:hypothetical protein M3Y95_01201400 [Aphelenchoides besseyi]|nr:hypothetical protein M3Y95_01201400 [Aphelenchoides besseyi]